MKIARRLTWPGNGSEVAADCAGVASSVTRPGASPRPRYDALARLLLGFCRALCCLPRRWLYALGAGLGRLAWRWLPVRREVVRTNLALCFPDKPEGERLVLEREHFRALGIGLVETLAAWSGRDQHLLGRLEWAEGSLELAAAARQRGRGLLVLGAHSTPMELVGAALRRAFPDLVCMYRHQSQPVVDSLMRIGRTRSGGHPGLHRSRLRDAFRVLERNNILWYAVDQDMGARHSVYAPFFGVPTATLRYAGRLARHTRALVCLLWCWRLPDGSGYRIKIEQLMLDGDAEREAALINAALERAVLEAPEQYFWVHRRFKTRPAGQPPVYRSRR